MSVAFWRRDKFEGKKRNQSGKKEERRIWMKLFRVLVFSLCTKLAHTLYVHNVHILCSRI